jgi:hypothetical protein
MSIFRSILQARSKTQLTRNNLEPETRVRHRPMRSRPVSEHPHRQPYGAASTFIGNDRRDSRSRLNAEPYPTRTEIRREEWDINEDSSDLDRGPEELYKLAATHPGGFRDLLADRCLSLLEKRHREFREFELHATDLQEDVSLACSRLV